MRAFRLMLVLLVWFMVFCGGIRAEDGRASDVLPREVVINGVEFVHVPAGWFWHVVGTGYRGNLPFNERWFRDVRIWLDGYYIAKYEARARDFMRFLQSGAAKYADEYRLSERDGCSVRRHEEGGEYFLVYPDSDLPATHLSWNLAVEFSQWMGFRLPAETEWVKAARGSDKRAFPWGNEYPDDTFAGFNSISLCAPSPVTAFANGKSPYGAYNMAGNVYEYVADWENHQHDVALKDGDRNPPLAETGAVGPGTSGPMKILKGGRWGDAPNSLHVHGRRQHPPNVSFLCYGVRFAVDERVVLDHLKRGTATVVN